MNEIKIKKEKTGGNEVEKSKRNLGVDNQEEILQNSRKKNACSDQQISNQIYEELK